MASKLQRKVNGVIRRVNKAWTEDKLLHGRFIIRQIQFAKEGEVTYFRFSITDKETGLIKETGWADQYDFHRGYLSYRLFDFFNDFIVRQLYKY